MIAKTLNLKLTWFDRGDLISGAGHHRHNVTVLIEADYTGVASRLTRGERSTPQAQRGMLPATTSSTGEKSLSKTPCKRPYQAL